jgi:catechol-2,3-dioxygenase
VFLCAGDARHDLALVQAMAGGPECAGNAAGLHHLGLRIGDNLDALREARVRLGEMDDPILWMLDHRVSQGIHITDPEGNLLGLYVDADPACGARRLRSWPPPNH